MNEDEPSAAAVEAVAARVEQDRSDRAAEVEEDRAARERAVEAIRVDVAAILEEDRKLHNLRVEELWKKRTRVVNIRLIVLYLALIGLFLFLAWRSETNERAIRDGLYEACLSRQETAQQNRDALLLMAMAPRVPPRTEQEQKNAREAIRLLIFVEDCGPDPR